MLQASMLTESPASSSPFCFQDHPIRTRIDNDQLWFVAKDVCAALDISLSGVTFRGFPKDWQGMMKFITPSGNQPFKVITEPAVYKLAFRSNKPEADTFTNWVASEVIPAIRNTGKFEAPAALPDTSSLTPSARAELKAIVDAKLSTYPSDVQGKARAEIWTRFNRHFKIAEYAQLPMCQMPDARDYLIEMKPKALAKLEAKPEQKALPASTPARPTAAQEKVIADASARLESMRASVIAEVHEVHVELLSLIDYAKIGSRPWHAISEYIYITALRSTISPLPVCLHGPASLIGELPHILSVVK